MRSRFILPLILVILSCIYPTQSAKACLDALSNCINVIIPSMLPLLTFADMLSKTDFTVIIGRILKKPMSKLFKLGGNTSCAFILGIISGYPTGAKTAVDLYKANKCSKKELESLLTFCNNSGPAFIIGVIGCCIFNNVLIGLILYGIHIISAITVGVLSCRRNKIQKDEFNKLQTTSVYRISDIFIDSVKNSCKSIAYICGFIIIFKILLTLFAQIPIIELLVENAGIFSGILFGMFEITAGLNALTSYTVDPKILFIICSFLIGWGGISVHFQALSFIKTADISSKRYIFSKIMQGLISSIIAFVLSFVIKFDVQTSNLSYNNTFMSQLKLSFLIFLMLILLIIIIFSVIYLKNIWKKRYNSV